MSQLLWYGGSNFDPRSLPGAAIIFDSRFTSNILDASDVPVTNGIAAKTWQDLSGIGNHGAQGTANNRPVWLASAINGLPALSFFPGANASNLTVADALSLDYTKFYMSWVGVRKEDKGANERIANKWTVTGNLREHSLTINSSDQIIGMGMVSPDAGGAATNTAATATLVVDVPTILEFWYDETAMFTFKNGLQIGTQVLASMNNGSAGYMLGTRDSLAEPFEGYYGSFRFCTQLPSAAQRLANRQDLSRTWGIAI